MLQQNKNAGVQKQDEWMNQRMLECWQTQKETLYVNPNLWSEVYLI